MLTQSKEKKRDERLLFGSAADRAGADAGRQRRHAAVRWPYFVLYPGPGCCT